MAQKRGGTRRASQLYRAEGNQLEPPNLCRTSVGMATKMSGKKFLNEIDRPKNIDYRVRYGSDVAAQMLRRLGINKLLIYNKIYPLNVGL